MTTGNRLEHLGGRRIGVNAIISVLGECSE